MKNKKVLEDNNIWNDSYYSKHLDQVIDIKFDKVLLPKVKDAFEL